MSWLKLVLSITHLNRYKIVSDQAGHSVVLNVGHSCEAEVARSNELPERIMLSLPMAN